MQYSPKLKKAAEEIKAILKKYDIGATVTLHTPGYSEYINEITPSYSCMKIDKVGFRIRAKLQEDFKGNKLAWTKKVTDTVNMIELFAETCGHQSMNMFKILKQLEEIIEIEKGDSTHTSLEEQNN